MEMEHLLFLGMEVMLLQHRQMDYHGPVEQVQISILGWLMV